MWAPPRLSLDVEARGRQLASQRDMLPTRRSLLIVSFAIASPLHAVVLPAGFQETVVISGLDLPTSLAFSADGRVFVAEKRGVIKVFDSLTDTSPDVFVDLRTQVHNFWDRGLLALALDPDFPQTPSLYVAYTFDAPIGGTAPVWGEVDDDSDPCPNPPGATADGCVVSGRVSRFEATGNFATGSEAVLVEGWCQQFPSHSLGDLVFGGDGFLYVSGGEGANFLAADYGQFGSPENPCGDPPAGVGGDQAPPGAMGGALRAQSPRRPAGVAAALGGTVLRIDPATGAAATGNPLIGSANPGADRIIAYGLRNPFRMAVEAGGDEIWLGDVGWGEFDEINRIAAPADAVVENFGWPCYEGPQVQGTFASIGLSQCESLYATPGAVAMPVYSYRLEDQIVDGESCINGTQSISGLAFYAGGDYPAGYAGALFFADYSRRCIWAMAADGDGKPDPALRANFVSDAAAPVDLEIGPDGDLFYVDFDGGTIRRIEFFAANQPPTAVLGADPTSGPVPLLVQFDGSQSSDPDVGDTLAYEWDLDGDGAFDDSTDPAPSQSYSDAGDVTVALRVTDPHDASDVASVVISPGNTAPVASIDMPSAATTWQVGDVIEFSGSATDAEDGALPASALTWTVILHHCPQQCHAHPIQEFSGDADGSFTAPDHSYPSFLELRLRATDSGGLTHTVSIELHPETVALQLQSSPAGLTLAVADSVAAAPFEREVIIGSTVTISAVSPQSSGMTHYEFLSWSDGGARTHEIVAPAAPATFTASYYERLDLTQVGDIVALVTEPGGGGTDLNVIRDGDKPEIGSTDSWRQYDSYDGDNAASEDWIGYVYSQPYVFERIVFQEGRHFPDGGWFTALGAQVRQGGSWQDVTGLAIAPAYPGINDGISFHTYSLDFDPIAGDGIRIHGSPGGGAAFISVGELEVFGMVATPTPSTTPTGVASATPTATPSATPSPTGTATATPAATAPAAATATPSASATPVAPTPSPSAAIRVVLHDGVGLPANAEADGRACISASLAGGGNVASLVIQLELDALLFALVGCSIDPGIGPGSPSNKTLVHENIAAGVDEITIGGGPEPIATDEDLFVCTYAILPGTELGGYAATLSATAQDSAGRSVAVDSISGRLLVTDCSGDCDGSGGVDIAEAVRAVNHFGGVPLCNPARSELACPVADSDNSGAVAIGEVVQSVNRFGSGCP